MEVNSTIGFKKTIEKFSGNGNIGDVPASTSNLTNMDVGEEKTTLKSVWAFMLFLNSITYSYCPRQNSRLD